MFQMDIPNYINDIIDVINAANYQVYVVGGAVRDALLKRPIHDYDLCTNASIEKLFEIFKDYNIINNNGLKHNTITLRYQHQNIEVSSFKNDSSDIISDLSYRDFSINAMAYNKSIGLIDPFNGLESIKNKSIEAVLDAKKRFKEDPIRILRAIRFSSSLGFKISDETKTAMLLLKDHLPLQASERVKNELEGIMVGDNILDILLEYKDIFGEIIPELIPTFNFNQNHRCHVHDVYTHICYVVSYTKADFRLRMAALFHDIAKPLTYTEIIKDGVMQGRFLLHPIKGCEIAQKVMKRLRFSNEEIEEILYLILNHDGLLPSQKKAVKKMLAKAPNASLEVFEKLIDLKNADRLDHRYLDSVKVDELISIASLIVQEKECFKITDLKISGRELMKLGFTGKKIGDSLKILLEKVINEEIENDEKILLEEAKKM